MKLERNYKGYTIKHKSLVKKAYIKWIIYDEGGQLMCDHYTLPRAKEWIDDYIAIQVKREKIGDSCAAALVGDNPYKSSLERYR